MKIGKREISAWKVIAAVVAVLITLGVAVAWPYAISGSASEGTIKIKRGTSTTAVCDSLQQVDVTLGKRVATLLGLLGVDMSDYQGAYRVNKGDTPLLVARRLRNGQTSPIRFTFNNVRTRDQWAKRVGDKFLMSSDEMLAALNDTAVCAKYGFSVDEITAMLQPDTYELAWDLTPEQLLDKMHGYYEKFWTAERVDKAKSLGLTPAQVATVASIVEEETTKADERDKVARLYLNRIAAGMPLQADPTVKFALGDFSIKRITIAMTRTQSPYNTYVNPGLPPGPIRLPEKATLDAVLNAPQHDYLYMCAKEDLSEYHNFAHDYATHLENARRYQAELDRRGIK